MLKKKKNYIHKKEKVKFAKFIYNNFILLKLSSFLFLTFIFVSYTFRAVTDPRDGRRVALKKLPNVFQSLVSSKRVFRELKMLCFFKHENVSKIHNFNFMRHERDIFED